MSDPDEPVLCVMCDKPIVFTQLLNEWWHMPGRAVWCPDKDASVATPPDGVTPDE